MGEPSNYLELANEYERKQEALQKRQDMINFEYDYPEKYYPKAYRNGLPTWDAVNRYIRGLFDDIPEYEE